jgi:hypothetical protein
MPGARRTRAVPEMLLQVFYIQRVDESSGILADGRINLNFVRNVFRRVLYILVEILIETKILRVGVSCATNPFLPFRPSCCFDGLGRDGGQPHAGGGYGPFQVNRYQLN